MLIYFNFIVQIYFKNKEELELEARNKEKVSKNARDGQVAILPIDHHTSLCT